MVRKAILMSVFLNKLVMNVVSFPIYLNVVQFYVCVKATSLLFDPNRVLLRRVFFLDSDKTSYLCRLLSLEKLSNPRRDWYA